MSVEEASDERKNFQAVQNIIDTLLVYDSDTRDRILQTVSTFFGIDAGRSKISQVNSSTGRASDVPAFADRPDLSPKDFLFQKKPKTDVERVACLAYYLANYRSMAHFKTTDINKLNTEAAQIKLSNASYTVNNATQSGFLVAAPKGMKQMSAAGERFVDLLPDHAEARKAMSELKPRRRRKTATSKSTANEQVVDG